MNVHAEADLTVAQAEALLECKRQYQAELERVSTFVDLLLDRIDAIDLELTGAPPVIEWGCRK